MGPQHQEPCIYFDYRNCLLIIFVHKHLNSSILNILKRLSNFTHSQTPLRFLVQKPKYSTELHSNQMCLVPKDETHKRTFFSVFPWWEDMDIDRFACSSNYVQKIKRSGHFQSLLNLILTLNVFIYRLPQQKWFLARPNREGTKPTKRSWKS